MASRKKSDMGKIISFAKTLVLFEPQETSMSAMGIIKHPFANNAFQVYKEKDGITILDIRKDEDRKKWQEQMKTEIESCDSVWRLFMLLTRPYYLTVFQYIRGYLSKQDKGELLRYIWTDIEDVNQNPVYSKNQLCQLFRCCSQTDLMDLNERNELAAMPEKVTIYRGVRNPAAKKGMSWTTHKDVAKWFAKRYGHKGIVYSADISKEKILAYFTGRNEFEVVVDPRDLKNICKLQ